MLRFVRSQGMAAILMVGVALTALDDARSSSGEWEGFKYAPVVLIIECHQGGVGVAKCTPVEFWRNDSNLPERELTLTSFNVWAPDLILPGELYLVPAIVGTYSSPGMCWNHGRSSMEFRRFEADALLWWGHPYERRADGRLLPQGADSDAEAEETAERYRRWTALDRDTDFDWSSDECGLFARIWDEDASAAKRTIQANVEVPQHQRDFGSAFTHLVENEPQFVASFLEGKAVEKKEEYYEEKMRRFFAFHMTQFLAQRGPASEAVLKRLMIAPESLVRVAAASELYLAHQDRRAKWVLLKEASGGSDLSRSWANLALARRGDKRALARMLRILESDDKELRFFEDHARFLICQSMVECDPVSVREATIEELLVLAQKSELELWDPWLELVEPQAGEVEPEPASEVSQ